MVHLTLAFPWPVPGPSLGISLGFPEYTHNPNTISSLLSIPWHYPSTILTVNMMAPSKFTLIVLEQDKDLKGQIETATATPAIHCPHMLILSLYRGTVVYC